MLSGYYPVDSKIKGLLTASLKKMDSSLTQDNIAIKHNAFTDYCLTLLFLSTGHRPVNTPFEAEGLFDLEDGLILISDKVVHESRAWRLAALPPLACEQLKLYASYLEVLPSHLHRLPVSQAITDEIYSLITGQPSIPYFFYLDEENPVSRLDITPASLAKRWQEHWKLPVNYLRHCMANELLHLTKRADLVSMQLGHITGVDHPFGVTSSAVTKSSLNLVAKEVQRFLVELGWRSKKLPIKKIGYNKSALLVKHTPSVIEAFGSEKRTQARKRRREKESKIIKASVKEIFQQLENEPTEENLHDLVDLVVEKAVQAKVSINSSLRFLYRFLRRQKILKENYHKFIQIRFLEEEPSPFNRRSLVAYRLTKIARKKFIEYLSEKGKKDNKLNTNLRLAEIVVSAALFSGLANSHKLEDLAECLIRSTYQFNKQVFVDFRLSKDTQATYRWFPDQLSLALIVGLYDAKKKPTFDKQKFTRELTNLISYLGFEQQKKQSSSFLAKMALSALIFEAPGHLIKYFSGQLSSTALPLDSWVRFQSIDKALVQPDKNISLQVEQDSTDTWLLNTFQPSVQKNKTKHLRAFLRKLREIFNSTDSLEARSNKNLSARKKHLLVKKIKDWADESSEVHASALKWTLVAWTVYLCVRGTRFKKNLAYSTIDNYVFLVARNLLPLQPEANFLNLTEDDYEEVYLRVLEASTKNIRSDLASRIIEFHKFLEEVYAVAEPSWNLILQTADSSKSESFADANLVSENEYLALLTLITKQRLTNQLKAQYIALLILGYRFGLRFGEAYRIRLTDIQLLDAKNTTLLVRNSIYGETKTNAGVRIVPLMESLTELEFISIKQLIDSASGFYDEEQQTFLMAEIYGSRKLINRYETSYQLGLFLKFITGDNTLRFHHLRHSWATRAYSYIYPNEANSYLSSNSLNSSSWSEFIGEHECNYPLSSLITAIGHQSITSTLDSYIHCIAETHKDLVNLNDYQIKAIAYSYALQVSQAVVRKRISRSSLVILSNHIPEPKIKLVKRPINLDSNKHYKKAVEFNLQKIDQLLRRFSETQQDVSKLAYQLVVDEKALTSLLNQAAKVERLSGFEFYRAQLADPTSLIDENQISYPKVNFYNQENKRVTNLLNQLDVRINQFTQQQQQAVTEGIKVWQARFVPRLNETIIADRHELDNFLQMLEHLNLQLKPSIGSPSVPDTKLENLSSIPQAIEKTRTRKLNRVAVKVQLNDQVKNYQALNRVFFILSTHYRVIDLDQVIFK